LDELLSQSFFNQEQVTNEMSPDTHVPPYEHLKARSVFPEENEDFMRTLSELKEIPDSFEKYLKILELSKAFLTALDQSERIAK
jgi:hypothetical protein